jgi:SAM-dependent methyltransferase
MSHGSTSGPPTLPAVPASGASGRIGAEYYDSSGYFEEGAAHLLDPDSPFQRYRVAEVLRIHEPVATDCVLDLGCGWGTFSAALAPRVKAVLAADFSLKSLELTRKRLSQEASGGRVRLLCADAAALPLADGSVDVVLAADLVEHLYPDQTAAMVEECGRVLRAGGKLVLWTPNPSHVLERLRVIGVLRADPSHVDYKTLPGLTTLLERNGFRIDRSGYRPSHLPVFRWAERMLQGIVPLMRRRITVLASRI